MHRRSLVALLALLGCSKAEAPPKAPLSVDLVEDLSTAIVQAGMSNRLVMLYFYSNTCDYCDRMNASLADASVQAALRDFIVVGVDVDTASDLGKQVQVVPSLVGVVPNLEGGEPVSSFQGFLNPKQLLRFVEATKIQAMAWAKTRDIPPMNARR